VLAQAWRREVKGDRAALRQIQSHGEDRFRDLAPAARGAGGGCGRHVRPAVADRRDERRVQDDPLRIDAEIRKQCVRPDRERACDDGHAEDAGEPAARGRGKSDLPRKNPRQRDDEGGKSRHEGCRAEPGPGRRRRSGEQAVARTEGGLGVQAAQVEDRADSAG